MGYRSLPLVLIAAAGLVEARSIPRVEAIDTEQTIFASGGTVEIKDSIGDVRVEGWDQPEVQVVVRKSVIDRDEGELDRVVVSAERRGGHRLVITTRRPARESEVSLIYQIRVPRQTRLIIAHDHGDVTVRNVTANMRVSNRTGRIDLSLPGDEHYSVDAKAKYGAVATELANNIGQNNRLEPLQILVRVGIGNITVRRAPKA